MFEPIPPAFYSEYSGLPFQKCVQCERDVLDGTAAENGLYIVKKVIVNEESVFEFCLCHACHEQLVMEMSDESRQRVAEFWNAQQGRQEVSPAPTSAEEAIATCRWCRQPRVECSKYSLFGLFMHDHILLYEVDAQLQLPMMLCDHCTQGVDVPLSQATRDRWDRFIAENFDGPPAIEEDLPHSIGVW